MLTITVEINGIHLIVCVIHFLPKILRFTLHMDVNLEV